MLGKVVVRDFTTGHVEELISIIYPSEIERKVLRPKNREVTYEMEEAGSPQIDFHTMPF